MPKGESLDRVELSSAAERDIPRLRRSLAELTRVKQALMDLGEDRTGLDVRPLEGHPPWQRLRAGDWRIEFRRLTPEESALVVPKDQRAREAPAFLVARVVNRRDLDKAIKNL